MSVTKRLDSRINTISLVTVSVNEWLNMKWLGNVDCKFGQGCHQGPVVQSPIKWVNVKFDSSLINNQ